MPVSGFYLDVRGVHVPHLELAYDLLRLIGRIEPVGLKGDYEKVDIDVSSRRDEVLSRKVEIVYGFGYI